MIIENNNYRKQIGLFQNKKNNNAVSYKQQRALSKRLANMPDSRVKYPNISTMFNLVLLFAHVSQLPHITLSSQKKISAGNELLGNSNNYRNSSAQATSYTNQYPPDPLSVSQHYRYPKKYRDLFKSVGNDINHRHFSLLTETTKSENVNRVLPLMEHNINYRKRRDIAPESVLAETYPSETNKNRLSVIKTIIKVYEENYPYLFKVAAEEIKNALFKRTGLVIDPDKVYFHHFTSAENDRTSITGWRHDYARPVESRTLTECVLNNFSAEAQDNMDVVDQMTGIYRVSATQAKSFGGENQVPVKPSVVASIIMEMDFFNLYINKLKKYWQKDIHEYVNMVKFIVEISRLTGENAKHTDLYLQAFNIINKPDNIIRKYLFDINGYQAIDILVLAITNLQHYVLYLSGERENFIYFYSEQAMKKWIIRYCNKKQNRNILASHFSIYDRQDGNFYDGIESWLGIFADADKADMYMDKIWKTKYEITQDTINFITRQQKNRALNDADNLIKSDSEVRRDMAIRYFSVINTLMPNPITPFISLGLDMDKMANGDDAVERKEGMGSAVDDGLNIVLMALSGLIERRFSIAFDSEIAQRNEKMPVSKLLQKEMKNFPKPPERNAPPNVYSRHINVNGLSHIKISSSTMFDDNITKMLKTLGVSESKGSLSHLSEADNYGIMHDNNGSKYLLIDQKLYKMRSSGTDGYYFFDEHNKVGIFFKPKIKKYQVIDLKRWDLDVPPPCKVVRSIRGLPNRYCLRFSNRLQKILDKHIASNVFVNDKAPTVIYDKEMTVFIDKKNNQKYLLYSNKYFPVQEAENGYYIYKLHGNQKNEKLTRIFYSQGYVRPYLITRMERIGEIFSLSRTRPRLPKMKLIHPLTMVERQALEDYHYLNTDRVNDFMVKRSSKQYLDKVSNPALMQQVENIYSALLKIKPERSTVFKIGQMKTEIFAALKKNDIFVTDSFTLAGSDKVLEEKSTLALSPGSALVKYHLQLKNRGYPINISVDGVTDRLLLIRDRSYFKTVDIYGNRIILKEMNSPETLNHNIIRSRIRHLDFTLSDPDLYRLQEEGKKVSALLKEDMSVVNSATDYIERYSNVLCDLAKNQVSSSVLEEYTEAGNDVINNWLRFGIDSSYSGSSSANEEVTLLLQDYEKLNDYNSYAFRSVEYPAGIYGRQIVEGDVIADKGFMSASALAGNSIGWKDSWSRNIVETKGEHIIMVFDKNIPKKNAGTGFLVDHILIKPRTPLKVVSIMIATDTKGIPVRIVCVNKSMGSRLLKDIYSGKPFS